MKNRPTVSTLLVDDDDVAVETVRRAFQRGNIASPIHRAIDGLDALDALRGTNGREAVPRPLIVLLDLRMPRMDGLRFLAALRADPEHRDTVVFMLTTSNDEKDRAMAYEHHVAGYLVKSDLEHDLGGLVELLDAYWRVVELPRFVANRGLNA